MTKDDSKPVKCLHCGYKWNTKSTKAFVACPYCTYKTPNSEIHRKGSVKK